MEDRIKPGDIVRHFKYETLTKEEQEKDVYLYRVIGFGIHTETKERVAIYQALYGNREIYVRPYSMFMEKVDTEKYPKVQQVYRLEPIC